MKRICAALLLAVMGSACAHAQEEPGLPAGVLAACEAAHPGYTVAASDGWGDGTWGQFALVLSQNGDNILCMAEKGKADAAYALTVDNTNAVLDGDALPSLMIGNAGDSLFYTYQDLWGYDSVHYHSEKRDGAWQDVDVTAYQKQADGRYESVLSGVWDGALRYEVSQEDENGNILDTHWFAPVPAGDTVEARMRLGAFDIDAYPLTPTAGVCREMLPGLAETLMDAGDTLVDLQIKRDALVMVVRKADGQCRVRVAYGQEDDGWRVTETGDVGAQVSLDVFHAGEDQIILYVGGYGTCGFTRTGETHWTLTWTTAEEEIQYGFDRINDLNAPPNIDRNDGWVYGAAPWGDMDTLDFASLPRTYAQALTMIDPSAYAMVRNPNPADRLHLREKPSRGAHSYGKFYNRTPVRVLERGDTWTKVRIGGGENSLTGYMMTEFLVFGEAEKAALACAFPQKHLRQDDQEGVWLRRDPDQSAYLPTALRPQEQYMLVGVVNDEWYVVMCPDGSMGYAPQAIFWDGNG